MDSAIRIMRIALLKLRSFEFLLFLMQLQQQSKIP
jgi:hypothetical protein